MNAKLNTNIDAMHHTCYRSGDIWFPGELDKITYSLFSEPAYRCCEVDTWNGGYTVYGVCRPDGTRELHIVATNGTDKVIVMNQFLAYFINYARGTAQKVTLPFHLRDKILWGINNSKYERTQTLEELDDFYNRKLSAHWDAVDAGEIQPGPCIFPTRIDYGKFHAVVVTDMYGDIDTVRCLIDGFPTKEEAIDILEHFQDGWLFSRSNRVQYVLDMIR